MPQHLTITGGSSMVVLRVRRSGDDLQSAGAAIKARSKSKARTPLIFSASMVGFSPKI
jgi:hypothetical protein